MRRIVLGLMVLGLVGCGSTEKPKGTTPSFVLAISEYPSWSIFLVAAEEGLINGKAGELGTIENKWNVDVVLKEADYDVCITLFGQNNADAACMTNMDTMAPSLARDAVAILPTSTSNGADACIAVGFDGEKTTANHYLANNTTFGLEKSVSEYVFERCLSKLNFDKQAIKFKNMDPAAASQAVQTGQKGINSIMVWNPFVLQTLKTKKDSTVLFSSDVIPEEIVDMVVVGKDSLNKEGGERFACAVIETYYEINKRLNKPETSEKTLLALSRNFSKLTPLDLTDMKIIVEQTKFYGTPNDGLAIFSSKKFQSETMTLISDFCKSHGIVDKQPTIGFNDPTAQFNFDDKYIKLIAAKIVAVANSPMTR